MDRIIAADAKFGKLTIVKFHSKNRSGHKYQCQCECGKECTVYASKLISSRTKSCGCSKYGNRPSAIQSGEKFGRLTAVELLGSSKGGRIWKFTCDCGAEHITLAGRVKFGQVQSCGCLFSEKIKLPRRGKHKMIRTPEYRTWGSMRSRCSRLDPDYGGRGIRVCGRWKSFGHFFADMGPRPSPEHSLDRIDPNGNYEPSNCRWATSKEQANNRRNTVYVEIDGRRITITDASKILNIPISTCHWRVRRGLPLHARI